MMDMIGHEYLVSYGRAGDFARFRSIVGIPYQRGDRVVVRSHQGLELGVVLCPATPGHARFLSRTPLGELLRHVNKDDERAAEAVRGRAQRLFDDARRLAGQLQLPIEILDVDILLDAQQAILFHLRTQDCDYRPLVSQLSRQHDMLIVMQNLALPKEPDGYGCGKPDCGRANGQNGCSTCGVAGGCGTCGMGTSKEVVASYLLGLRQKMAEHSARTSLL